MLSLKKASFCDNIMCIKRDTSENFHAKVPCKLFSDPYTGPDKKLFVNIQVLSPEFVNEIRKLEEFILDTCDKAVVCAVGHDNVLYKVKIPRRYNRISIPIADDTGCFLPSASLVEGIDCMVQLETRYIALFDNSARILWTLNHIVVCSDIKATGRTNL